MTEQEFNDKVKNGEVQVLPQEPQATQNTDDPFDENTPIIELMRRPRRALSATPTFVPKSFAESIQLVDDGVTKSLYVYINKTWVKLASGAVAGNDKNIQVNNNGTLAGYDDFQWDENIKELVFGDDTTIRAADGTSGGMGKSLEIRSGDGDTGQLGGDVGLTAGIGGDAVLTGGVGDGTNGLPGGDASISGGFASGTDCDAGNVVLHTDTGNGTGKSGTIIFRSSGNEAQTLYVNGTLLTTNGTPTTISSQDVPTMAESSALFIQARVVARRTTGSAGSADDSAAYVRRACYKRVGSAAPTLVGSIQDDFTVEDQAGWDATFIASGNDIALQVTGAASNTIRWRYELIFIRHEF